MISFLLSDPGLYYVVKADLLGLCNQNYSLIRSNNSNEVNAPVSLSPIIVNEQVKVYPNPFNDEIKIEN